jgi:nucleoside 2-deoxyribosyltransferase
MEQHVVYCSGPMFTAGDLWEQQRLATALESVGYLTYLPQRDGIEVGRVMQLLNYPQIASETGQAAMSIVRKVVFSLDVYQLLARCTCVVFNLDGRVPDEGSVVETSLAYAAGKPIVIYKTTPVTFLAGQDNPMIEGFSTTWTNHATIPDVIQALQGRIAAHKKLKYEYHPPIGIKHVIDIGRHVADPMSDVRKVLAKIMSATDGDTALKSTRALLRWARNSRAYQAAFGDHATWTNHRGHRVSVPL